MFVPHSLLSYLHVYFGHITHHSGTQISTVFGYNFPLALTNGPLSLSETSILRQLQEFHLSLLSPLQEDNVAIAIAMNGINIFFMSMI
jgi:hypothetical protein